MKSTNQNLVLLASDKTIPPDIDVYELEPYLLFMPGKFKDTSVDYQMKLIQHFQDSLDILNNAIKESDELLAKQIERVKEIQKKVPNNLQITNANRDDVIKYYALFEAQQHLSNKLEHTHLASCREYGDLLQRLLKFTEWLVQHPHLIYVNLKRALPSVAAKTYHADQKVFRESRAINLAYREQIAICNCYPPNYVFINANKVFCQNAVDQAMAARKAATSYFEEIPVEDDLFEFFDSQFAPLSKENLVPIKIASDFDSVNSWLERAIDVIVKYDGIENTERKEVIVILLLRYLFRRTYPLLKPELYHSPSLLRTMEFVANRTPIENNVPEKYIPAKLRNEPTKVLFKSNSIASAPVEWLNLVQFKVCPLDMAYCIFKVHESLSIMVTLEASHGNPDTSDFFAQMPGFDDIFDIWICLLSVATICDPAGIVQYIMKWSRLTGFPHRFMACCAYLEAAVEQLNNRISLLPELCPPKPVVHEEIILPE